MPWKELGGAGGLLVVKLRMVAACGGCGDLVWIVLMPWRGREDGEAGGVVAGGFCVVGLRMVAAFGATLVEGGDLFSIIIVWTSMVS